MGEQKMKKNGGRQEITASMPRSSQTDRMGEQREVVKRSLRARSEAHKPNKMLLLDILEPQND